MLETSLFFGNWSGAWKTIIHSSKNDNICLYTQTWKTIIHSSKIDDLELYTKYGPRPIYIYTYIYIHIYICIYMTYIYIWYIYFTLIYVFILYIKWFADTYTVHADDRFIDCSQLLFSHFSARVFLLYTIAQSWHLWKRTSDPQKFDNVDY